MAKRDEKLARGIRRVDDALRAAHADLTSKQLAGLAARLDSQSVDEGELIELAWGIIANASGGNWELESADWQGAAERWRDAYHRWLDATSHADEANTERERFESGSSIAVRAEAVVVASFFDQLKLSGVPLDVAADLTREHFRQPTGLGGR